MAEPFKNLINAGLAQQAAQHLSRVHRGFDARRFTQLATTGLDTLEMKARAMRIADALEATLPANFDAAAGVLEAAMAPPVATESIPAGLADGLRGWMLWPAGEFIARRGMDQPERALNALHALTQRFTAEWAIRPFIVHHPAMVFQTLQRWCGDPSLHVRRLVSEGSRPRLPWGLRLQTLVQDPAPTLPLLRRLQDDPAEYVRRSVANHLNDIAKDHPAVVAAWLQQHLPGASEPRRALLRHASRSLIKAGDGPTLKAWGLGQKLRGEADLRLSPQQVALGDSVTLTLHLRSTSRQPQRLAIDYAVHHVKANGSTSPKVFKGWQVELPAQGTLTLVKAHSMREVTTRRYHAGRHGVSVQINGQPLAEAAFVLRMPP